jgi:two-component system, NarL family, response regulator LiaR
MSDTQPIRVLIVDDHAMVRSGLKNFIYGYDSMELVGEAGNGTAAVKFCATHDVDVVLMDMIMPEMDGSEATRRIIATGKPIKIVILTSFHEQDLVEQALKAGATSYLLKNVSAEELAVAIRNAHAGQATLAQEATDALIQITRRTPGVGADLTEREREVLALLVDGNPNSEIATRLSISLATVKFHLANIYSKLGVDNRVDAVRLSLENHLVTKKSSPEHTASHQPDHSARS